MKTLLYKISKRLVKFYESYRAKELLNGLKSCGEDVTLERGANIKGLANISIGNHVYIGENVTLYGFAGLSIGDFVMFGPNVSIITGDHRTDVKGKPMFLVKEKKPENDLPVTIEDDVWIGTGVIILKGVTIHKGSIIGAGAVVTHDVEEYSILTGCPSPKIRDRF